MKTPNGVIIPLILNPEIIVNDPFGGYRQKILQKAEGYRYHRALDQATLDAIGVCIEHFAIHTEDRST